MGHLQCVLSPYSTANITNTSLLVCATPLTAVQQHIHYLVSQSQILKRLFYLFENAMLYTCIYMYDSKVVIIVKIISQLGRHCTLYV